MDNIVTKPKSIKKSEIFNKEFLLTPSRYKYVEIKNKNILPINKIFFESKKNVNLENNKGYYKYVEIGSINNSIGSVSPSLKKSVEISSNIVSDLELGDILISTVRTYLGGIGIINKDLENLVASKALIVLRDLKIPKDKFYLFGILRSPFFIEQVSIILNASMYPRMERDYFKKLYIPFPTTNNNLKPELIEKYVSVITQNIINKEEQIEQRQSLIDNIIYSELLGNQKSTFQYNLPKKSDLLNHKRIDTGLYTEKYKKENHLIENYKKGYFQIPVDKFKSGSTPRIRIFNGTKFKYQWVTPTNITDEGFFVPVDTISTPKVNNLNKDCILFINRTSKGKKGEYVGITCFYDFGYYGLGQHNQGLYRIDHLKKDELLFISAFMNSKIMRKLCGNISIGSKMKEMKSYDFATLKYPNFEKELKQKIKSLYYFDKPKTEYEINDYLVKEKNRNKEIGIFQLNTEIIELKNKLKEIIDKIINEKPIEIDF